MSEGRMEKPNLKKVWVTYIKIGPLQEITLQRCIDTLRNMVSPMILDLKEKSLLRWYSFLVHPGKDKADPNGYYHIRFELKGKYDTKERINSVLPDYCEKTMTYRFRDVENLENITSIDKSILKNRRIEEAWRIIGEQSEWVTKILDSFGEEFDIPDQQFIQYVHFLMNMLGLGNQSFYAPKGEILRRF